MQREMRRAAQEAREANARGFWALQAPAQKVGRWQSPGKTEQQKKLVSVLRETSHQHLIMLLPSLVCAEGEHTEKHCRDD
jgi:hypothetical protein